MKGSSAKVNSQHQITIPEWARRRLNIKSGDHLVVDVQDGVMRLLPIRSGYTETLAGLHQDIWQNAEQYIVQERDSWAVAESLKGDP